jgi:hypothetical protein
MQFPHIHIATRRLKLVVVLLLAVLPQVSGCDDGRPQRVRVSGTVTIDGKPATSGSIQFLPQGGGGRPSAGRIESDGKFSLFTYEKGDGCPLGTFNVVVSSTEIVSDTQTRYNLPKKYGNPASSGITKRVEGPIDDMKIELTWGGAPGPFVEASR